MTLQNPASPPPPAPPPPPEVAAKTHDFPCTSCGGDLHFAPETQDLGCPHCGVHTPLPPVPYRIRGDMGVEHDLDRALKGGAAEMLATDEVRTTTCPDCSVQLIFEGALHAKTCPFCTTPVVVDTATRRQIKPQGVLPFQITQDQASEALIKWLEGLWLAPNALKRDARQKRGMRGVYIPFWSFDARTRSTYRGERGITTTTTHRKSDGSTETRSKTSWTATSGTVTRDFDDFAVLASRGIARKHAEELEPWDMSDLRDYSPALLAGFEAEGYQIDLENGALDGEELMGQAIMDTIRSDIGGHKQRVTSRDTTWSDRTFRHVLLPVWIAAYTFEGKTYRFIVNGQTGEVQGNYPKAWWKENFQSIFAAGFFCFVCLIILLFSP